MVEADLNASWAGAPRNRRGPSDVSQSDPVLRYVLEAAPLHDALRLALIQLSGFLLKRLTFRPTSVANFEPVEAARAALSEAVESLRSVRAPAAATHHQIHLEGAAAALEGAVEAAWARSDPAGDALFLLLEQAETHLRAASRTGLPGFDAVDFSQACCAAHAVSPSAQAMRCLG